MARTGRFPSHAAGLVLVTVALALDARPAHAQAGTVPAKPVAGVVTESSARAAAGNEKPVVEAAKPPADERSGARSEAVRPDSEPKGAGARPPRPRAAGPVGGKPVPVSVAPAAAVAAVAEPKVAADKPAPPRPSVVVDGTAAAAEVPRGPEIEVRVSASQQRENAYRNAVNLLGEGRSDEADKLLRQILAEHPGHDSARQARIGIALKRHRFGEAEALADERLEHGAEHLGFAIVSARLKLDRGDSAAALEVLKRSDVHARSNPDYQALTAAVLQRLSRHAEAADRFRAAIALQPGSGIWLMGLGVSLQALERPAEAAEAFKRARESTNLTPELRAFVDQRMTELRR